MERIYQDLRRALIEHLHEFAPIADEITIDVAHPFWDDDIVEAMADAVLAVARAASATRPHITWPNRRFSGTR